VNGATLTTDRFGVANSAYSFDGVNDNIRVNNNALFSFLLNSSFTTNLWFSVQVVPNGTKFLIGQGDGDAQHQNRLWGSYVNQSELRNWFRGNVESNQVWNISPLPSTNVWKMISMVRDYNNTIKMYVDGQLVDTDVDIAGIASPFTQIRDIYFGALYDAYNSQLQSFFNGQLDDIGIWNRALTQQEITQLYNVGQATYSWSPGGATTPSITVSPTQTTTYTCTITMNGATTTQTQTITVNALPNVSGGTNQTVCAGTSVTLSGSGASTYTWNNNVQDGVAFTPVSTQTYTVTGTDANGCTNAAQTTITVNALPTVGAGANQTVCAGTSVTLSGSGANTYAWNNNVQDGVAFTPASTQTYTVNGTDANGCTNTAQVQVTVNALPTVGAGANQTVCAGTSVTLSGSGASTYAWNNNVQDGVAFTPASTQTYTVTGTDANGCTNTAQTTITVNALPTVGAGSNQTVCAGTSVTLSGSGASTYVWNNNVQDGVAFTPASTQTYTVTGTDANGCTNTAQVLVTVSNPSSSTVTETACLSYTLNGQSYTQSGTYQQNLTNVLGCDSTLTLTLTILPLPNVPNIYLALNNVMSTDAQANTSYQWIHCTSGLPIANATDTFYMATINGVYAVEASNSCGTVASDCITISNSGLDENVIPLKLFPNPSKDFITIDGIKESSINFELRDVHGRLIRKGMLDATNNSLDMKSFSDGNYRLILDGYGVFSVVKY
jgi:hypothetical protein